MQFKINSALQVNHIVPVAFEIIVFISITGAVPFKVKQTSSPVADLFMSSLQLPIKRCSPFPAVRGALKIKIFQFSEKNGWHASSWLSIVAKQQRVQRQALPPFGALSLKTDPLWAKKGSWISFK